MYLHLLDVFLLVVSLVNETCKSLLTVGAFEGTVCNMSGHMLVKFPLFIEIFVTSVQRAKV
jgi:hypothetical protein